MARNSNSKDTSNKVVKPIKNIKSAKTKKLEKNDKIIKNNDKKTQNLKKRIEKQKKEEEEEAEKEAAEKEADFELPSDSDDGEETDSELVIHNDIIENDEKESVNKSSSSSSSSTTQNGHTIIKPSSNKEKKISVDKSDNQRGVIYVGRLPKGFEEKELKKYFQQFGDITRLRLSRNKKTGQSKHYGFIEFKEFEVAKIAYETMNNYLLMGHLLKVSLLTNDKIHENLFIGANSKFKIIPFNKINKRKYEKGRSIDEWNKLNENHLTNLKSKQEKLISKGIDFDISNI